MELAGIRKSVNTKISGDDLAGLRRTAPARTLITPADSEHLHRTHPANTSLANSKPALRTQITDADLNGVRAKHSALSEHDRLVKQTQTLVSQTFFGTLMKQMRDSPFKSEMFDGGRGGQAFGSLYDQHLTERMSRGAGAHLVNSIVRRLEARANAVRAQVTPGRKAA